MKNKRTKKILSLSVTAAVAAGAYFAYTHFAGAKTDEVSYQAAKVQRGRVVSQVTATGTLQPRVTVQVGSQVSGRILELRADFNSQVKKGQLLAKLDPQLLDASVTRARASQSSASAGLTRASAQKKDAYLKYTRAKALAAKSLVAKADVESAWAAYESAKAQVSTAWADLQQAKAALDQAKTNQAYATIVSPIDGIVISRDVDVGQTVAASLSAPTLFTIAETLEKMEIHTSVAESDVGKVAPNQKVNFTVDAYPNERFGGVVKQIRYSPKTESNVVTYDAVIAVENAELKLRPGMTANVNFIVAQADDALLVPNAALRFKPSDDVLAKLELTGAATTGSRGRRGSGPGAPRAQLDRSGKSGIMTDARRAERRKRRAANARKRTLWLLDASGMPKPVIATIGITDGSMTEVISEQLKAGAQVIVGTGKGGAAAARAGSRGGNRRGGRRGMRGRFL